MSATMADPIESSTVIKPRHRILFGAVLCLVVAATQIRSTKNEALFQTEGETRKKQRLARDNTTKAARGGASVANGGAFNRSEVARSEEQREELEASPTSTKLGTITNTRAGNMSEQDGPIMVNNNEPPTASNSAAKGMDTKEATSGFASPLPYIQQTADYIFSTNSSFEKNHAFLQSFPEDFDGGCRSEDWTKVWPLTPSSSEPPSENTCFPKWEGYGDNTRVLRECLRNMNILVIGDSWGRELSIELARTVNQTELEQIDENWKPEVPKSECRPKMQVVGYKNATDGCGAHGGDFFGSGARGIDGDICGTPALPQVHLSSHNFTITHMFKTYFWSPLVEEATQELLNTVHFDAVLLYIGRWGQTQIPVQRKYGLVQPNEPGKCFDEQFANYYTWLSNLTKATGNHLVVNLQTKVVKGNCTENPGPKQGSWYLPSRELLDGYMPGMIHIDVDSLQTSHQRSAARVPYGHGLAGPFMSWLCHGVAHVLCQATGRCSFAASKHEPPAVS